MIESGGFHRMFQCWCNMNSPFSVGTTNTGIMRNLLSLALLILVTLQSCSSEDGAIEEGLPEDAIEQEDETPEDSDMMDDSEDDGEPTEQGDECPDSIGFVFEEQNGLISIEFENNDFPEGWILKNDVTDVSGEGYMQWEGNPSMGNPGNGIVTFPVKITNTGTYRFIWKSSYRKGNNGTEHNDSWLRFPDADNFFGMKNDGSVVYPNGSGKEPNPNGASKEGWFKVYRSGNDNEFKWQSKTSDNDAHDIYVSFESPGVYLMEISARSDFHAIDRILIHQEDISLNAAIDQADNFSLKATCD